jgi:hypothetical protein
LNISIFAFRIVTVIPSFIKSTACKAQDMPNINIKSPCFINTLHLQNRE